jgi:hypothetical protein
MKTPANRRLDLLNRAKAEILALGGIISPDGICVPAGSFAGVRDFGGQIEIAIERPSWRKGFVSRSFRILTENA